MKLSYFFLLTFSSVWASECDQLEAKFANNYFFEKESYSEDLLSANVHPPLKLKLAAAATVLISKNCLSYKDLGMNKQSFDQQIKRLAGVMYTAVQSKMRQEEIYNSPDNSVEEDIETLRSLSKNYPEAQQALNYYKQNKPIIEERKKSLNTYLKDFKCEEIDHQNKLPPVRHQDSVGWCDANVAADLLSFKLGQEVSALDISLTHQKTIQTQEIFEKTGVPEGTYDNSINLMNDILEQGVCLEEHLPSEDAKLADENWEIETKLASDLSQLIELKNLVQSTHTISQKVICDRALEVGHLFPTLAIDEIVEILKEGSEDRYFSRLRSKACLANKVKPQNLEVKGFRYNHLGLTQENFIPSEAEKYKILENIKDQLKAGNILGIEHTYDMLIEKDFTSKAYGQNYHASSVVGMRQGKSGECEFKLRGTWGERARFPEHESQDGYVWVSARELSANTRLVYFLD